MRQCHFYWFGFLYIMHSYHFINTIFVGVRPFFSSKTSWQNESSVHISVNVVSFNHVYKMRGSLCFIGSFLSIRRLGVQSLFPLSEVSVSLGMTLKPNHVIGASASNAKENGSCQVVITSGLIWPKNINAL